MIDEKVQRSDVANVFLCVLYIKLQMAPAFKFSTFFFPEEKSILDTKPDLNY